MEHVKFKQSNSSSGSRKGKYNTIEILNDVVLIAAKIDIIKLRKKVNNIVWWAITKLIVHLIYLINEIAFD